MHSTSHEPMRTMPVQRASDEGCVTIPRQRPGRSVARRRAIAESAGRR